MIMNCRPGAPGVDAFGTVGNFFKVVADFGSQKIARSRWRQGFIATPGNDPEELRRSRYAKKRRKEKKMIEITVTEKAKAELVKVLESFNAKTVRLIRQGFG